MDVFKRVGKQADADAIDRAAHQLGPYYEQDLDQELATIQADVETAKEELTEAQDTFASTSTPSLVAHLERLGL